MKKVISLASLFMLVFVGVLVSNNTSALTYQDELDIKFTFNSTLSLSLSDNALTISNLVPGNSGVSNAINVTVNTNNVYGYTLSATVGNSSNDYRDLKHEDSAATFSSIDVGSDMSTITGTGSLWGFSKSLNGSTWSNYSGLPKYDDTSNTAELNSSFGAVSSAVTGFRIGAKAAEGQLAGDYTNVINFIAVAKATVPSMQDITSSNCPTAPLTVIDSRDNEQYTIQKLADGKCWLLDNLRLDLTTTRNLSTSDTNITSDWTAPVDITSWSASWAIPSIYTAYKNTTGSGGYEAGKYGIYYNYCAATAGTYCVGLVDIGNATQDICPKGWRMPSLGEYSTLYTAYSSKYANFVNAFHTPFAGYVFSTNGGEIREKGITGTFWTSVRRSDSNMYVLEIFDSTVDLKSTNDRNHGNSVRCVAK